MKFNALTFLFLLLMTRLAAFVPDDLPHQFRLLPQPEKIEILSRMLNNPEGYQLDSHLHEHLAMVPTIYWMFMYEIPFNTKVREWLTGQPANK